MKSPMEAVETIGLERIFMKFAFQEQKSRIKEIQRRYWDLLLCLEDAPFVNDRWDYRHDQSLDFIQHCIQMMPTSCIRGARRGAHRNGVPLRAIPISHQHGRVSGAPRTPKARTRHEGPP